MKRHMATCKVKPPPKKVAASINKDKNDQASVGGTKTALGKKARNLIEAHFEHTSWDAFQV